MQNGDIGNTVVPRLVIVWEHLLGLLPDKTHEAKAATYLKLHRWDRAAKTFELNTGLAHQIWDVVWRMNYQVEVVTYLDEKMIEPIEAWIERHDLPISRVWADDPDKLSRRLAHMPYVAAVYDPDPAHRFRFGAKGRFMPPHEHHLLGRF